MENFSQTQATNIAKMIVAVLMLFFPVMEQDKAIFVISSILVLAFSAYSFYQRYKKGDLTISGVRKPDLLVDANSQHTNQ